MRPSANDFTPSEHEHHASWENSCQKFQDRLMLLSFLLGALAVLLYITACFSHDFSHCYFMQVNYLIVLFSVNIISFFVCHYRVVLASSELLWCLQSQLVTAKPSWLQIFKIFSNSTGSYAFARLLSPMNPHVNVNKNEPHILVLSIVFTIGV